MQEKTKIITKLGVSSAFTIIFVVAMIILLVFGYKVPFLKMEITNEGLSNGRGYYNIEYAYNNNLKNQVNDVKIMIDVYDTNDNIIGTWTSYWDYDAGQDAKYVSLDNYDLDDNNTIIDIAYSTVNIEKPLLYNLGYAMIPFVIIFGYVMVGSIISFIQLKNKEKANSERKVENLVEKPVKKQKDKTQKEVVAEVNSASETLNSDEKTEETNSQSNNIKEINSQTTSTKDDNMAEN